MLRGCKLTVIITSSLKFNHGKRIDMKNKFNTHDRVDFRTIKTFTAFCLAIIMVAGGLRFDLLTVGATNDSAGCEPTIASFSIEAPYQTRAEFVSAGQPIYFEGTIYSRPDFF
jgi:hypothetical protein